jgi:RNA 2',3'-cyclic 3'-phosphodiesterase
MRLFVAIGLPDNWKELLAEPEKKIGWLGKGVKWVEPLGMHLTLKFLGEVDEHVLPSIENGLAAACRWIAPFPMRISGTGTFPSRSRPRVYWAGLEAPGELMELQRRVDEQMISLGFDKEENKFQPHLTLARIKDPIGKDRMTDAVLNFKIEGAPTTVTEVLLMQSHLTSEGPHYEAIRRFPLEGSATPR